MSIKSRFLNAIKALQGHAVIQEVKVPHLIPYDVIRQQLGSIDRNSVRYMKDMTETEYSDHIAAIDRIVGNNAFKAEIDALIDAQAYWIAEKATEGQLSFGRGTINGLSLVKERFANLSTEHRKKSQPADKINPYNVAG